jgi:3',5'-cyclic AMP phosphodiesterase CpdA
MEKSFNEASRKLFSAYCPISECENGKPSNRYVDYKIYESYFNLLDRFAEFKPQVDAINSGKKVWHSEFEINGKKYTTKTLDKLTQHNYGDSASFSTAYLPEGYVRVETEDSVEFFPFAELHNEIRKSPEQLEKFDKAFVKAQKSDITDEYFSDLRLIFANTLAPMCAIAKDEVAFNKMLGLVGTYHPEIINFVYETYNSPKGLSQILEHQADISLKELRERPETLEDVLETGILAKIATAVKRVSTTIPGLLVATAAGAVATHSNSHTDFHDFSDDNHISGKDFNQKSSLNNSWENTDAINAPTFTRGTFDSYGVAYISEHNEVLLLKRYASCNSYETWAYHTDTNTWENKTTAQKPSEGKVHNCDVRLGLAYDIKNDKVVFLEDAGAAEPSETWVYDPQINSWINKTTGAEPRINNINGMQLAYDEQSGKIIVFQPQLSDETWIYDYINNKWESKLSSVLPKSKYGDYKVFYRPINHKVLCASDQGLRSYNTANNEWENKSGPPKSAPLPPSYSIIHKFTYDEQSDKIINLVEQVTSGTGTVYSGTWAYDFLSNNWSNLVPANHQGEQRYAIPGFTLVYDSKNDKIFNMVVGNSKPSKIEVWQYSLDTPSNTAWNPNDFFVMAADTHVGASNAEKVLENLVADVNSMNPKPKFVLVAGDASDWGADAPGLPAGSENLQKFKNTLDKLSVPWYAVPGNHDARNWGLLGSTPGNKDSFADYKAIIPSPSNQDAYAIEFDKLVVFGLNSGWDSMLSNKGDILLPEGSGLTDAQISWLEDALQAAPAEKQKILVMHNPVTADQDGSISNNYAKLLQLCKQYKITTIGGHAHQMAHESISGVDSWQVPSLAYQRAFAEVSLDGNNAELSYKVLMQSTGIKSHSPVHVGIVGSDNKVSGVDLAGTLKQELPGTVYIAEKSPQSSSNDSIEYLSVDGQQKKFTITGIEEGAYTVKIEMNDNEKQKIEISANTKKGQVDTVELNNWSSVANNSQTSVHVDRDINGDGRPEISFTSDPIITEDDFKNPQSKNAESLWTLIGAGAVGASAAAGVAYTLYRRYKSKPGDIPATKIEPEAAPDEEKPK